MRLVILCLLLILGLNVAAQDHHGPEQVDCNALTGETSFVLEPFEYTFACDTIYDCVPQPYFLCQMQLAAAWLELCQVEDLFCQNHTLLKMAPINDWRPDEEQGWRPPQSLIDTFPDVLNAFAASEFENALSLLQIPESTTISHPLLSYTRGLIYEMLNEPDAALREYDAALAVTRHHLLTRYTRGLLLGRIGRETEASFESAWLEDYLTAFAPDLLPSVARLTERYLLDQSLLSHWIKYPIMLTGTSPAGEFYTDFTRTVPTPVQIGIYDEHLLGIDISILHYRRFSGDILNTYTFQKIDDQTYRHEFLRGIDIPDNITLTFKDGLIFGEERLLGAESWVTSSFILAPPHHPDPRQSFGEPICEDGVISRLRPGMAVREMGYIGGFYYAETPGAEITLYFDDGYREDMTDSTYPWLEVSVTDRFVCIEDELWWEVTDGLGNTGWRAENVGTEYQINPVYDLLTLFYCPGAPRIRLITQREGQVLPGFGANNLRAEPGTNAELLGTIPEKELFTVLDGPLCAGEMAWWKVEYDGLVGWTSEGAGDVYWVR